MAGLLTVLAALAFLAAVLPQGSVDFQDLKEQEFDPDLTPPPDLPPPPDLSPPPDFTPPTHITPPDDITEEDLRRLQELAEKYGLSGPQDADLDGLTMPPLDPGDMDYPSDRNSEPTNPVCQNVYTVSSTCHNRIFVFDGATRLNDGRYTFQLADGARTVFAPGEVGSRTVSSGTLSLDLSPGDFTPVVSLTPDQVFINLDLLDWDSGSRPAVNLYRDANDMVWATANPPATVRARVTWAISNSYFDNYVPPGLDVDDVPGELRPTPSNAVRNVGLQIASHVGVSANDDYDEIVGGLRDYFSAFGEGDIPDRDEYSDDMLAIAYGQNGCCRHRAEAFLVTAQSLGVPTRMVVNEAHAFTEVWVPGLGWRMVDLGGCGDYDAQNLENQHEEVETPPDTPVNDNLNRDQPPPPTQPAATAEIELDDPTGDLRRGQPFRLEGRVDTELGPHPAGVAITVYYNRTKETPGTAFCTTQTDGTRTFATDCTLPSNMPVGDFQLVARVAPTQIGSQRIRAAFSDPPITIDSETRLTLSGPTRTARGTPIEYVAHLRGDQDEPVPDAAVALSLDGSLLGQPRTDANGDAHISVTFNEEGAYRLTAAFVGDDYYGPSDADYDVDVREITLTAEVDTTRLGDRYVRVTGTVRDAFGAIPRTALTASLRGAQTTAATTATGDFTVELRPTTLPAGAHAVHLLLTDLGVTIDAPFVHELPTTLDVAIPTHWHGPTPFTLRLQLSSEIAAGSVPVPAETILLRIDQEPAVEVTTNATGSAAWTAPDPLTPGPHLGRVEYPGTVGHAPASRESTVKVGTVALRHESRQNVVAPDATWELSGDLQFDGAPLPANAVLLAFGATQDETTTDPLGGFALNLRLPRAFPVGPADADLRVDAVGFQADIPLLVGHPTRISIELDSLAFSMGGQLEGRARATDADGTTVDVPLEVTVAGRRVDVAADGAFSVPVDTWWVRRSTIEVYTPGQGENAATTASQAVTIVNPIPFGALLLALTGAGLIAYVVTRRRKPPPTPQVGAATAPGLPPTDAPLAKLLAPTIAPGLPPWFDPVQDQALHFELPPALATEQDIVWETGKPAQATVTKSRTTLALKDVALGPHQLHFRAPGSPNPVQQYSMNLVRFHEATDESFRELIGALRGQPVPAGEPIRLSEAEELLRTRGGVPDAQANELRRHYERAIYAREDCDRPTFEAYLTLFQQVASQATATLYGTVR